MIDRSPRWRLPVVDGRFVVDGAALEACGRDFGGVVRQRPTIVLVPASVSDVQRAVSFARERGMFVVARGAGHSAGGQSQASGGLIISMAGLSRVHEIDEERRTLDVDAGASWHDIMLQVVARGLTPPTVTDWMYLTIGGTVATGGVGSQSFRAGVQSDHVLEAEVVTGDGRRVRCSPDEEPELFDAVRAGVGQFGIIVRLKMRLIPAPKRVTVRHLVYDDFERFVAATESFARAGAHDTLLAHAMASDDASVIAKFGPAGARACAERTAGARGPWLYDLEAVDYAFDDAAAPSDVAFSLEAERDPAVTCFRREYTFVDYIQRVPPIIEVEQRQGAAPHPEMTLFVSSTAMRTFVAPTMEALTPESVGGTVLFIPMTRDRLRSPMLRVPECERPWLFGVLRAPPPSEASPARLRALVRENLALYREGQRHGVVRYLVDSLPTPRTSDAWREHYGAQWRRVDAARRRYDPAGLFVPNVRCPPPLEESMNTPPKPIKIGSLDHYTLIVPDGEAACEFYTNVLGFELVGVKPVNCGTAPEGAHDMMNWILRHPTDKHETVVLTEGLTEESVFVRLLRKHGPHIHHVAFCVDELDATVERLRRDGVTLTSEEVLTDPVTGLRQIFISSEHAGHFVELIERTPLAESGIYVECNMAGLANTMEPFAGARPDAVEEASDGVIVVARDIDAKPEDALAYVADVKNLPRWTCHRSLREIDGRWVEIRLHGDVEVEAGRAPGGERAYIRWRRDDETRTASFRVQRLGEARCRVELELREVPLERRPRTRELLSTELTLLGEALAPTGAPLTEERARVDRFHLDVYQREPL